MQLVQDGRDSSHYDGMSALSFFFFIFFSFCLVSYLHSAPLTFHAAVTRFPMWSSERHSHEVI